MRKAPILALLLAGCGGGEGEPAGRPPVQTATLTGLYQSAGGARPNQLCITTRGGESRFGLVTWRGAAPGCSGAGAALRRGGTLRLVMAGEQACALDARIEGVAVAFPDRTPPGCDYYCAPGATLAGVAFVKAGGTDADALRARDLVGDPLCG